MIGWKQYRWLAVFAALLLAAFLLGTRIAVWTDDSRKATGADPPPKPTVTSPRQAVDSAAEQDPNDPVPRNPDRFTVTLRVAGVKPGAGPLRCAVFEPTGRFPQHEQALRRFAEPATQPTIEFGFELAPGQYALAVYQDLNDDGSLTKGLFGAPVEPYGFSNNARGRLGPPSFQASAFQVDPASSTRPLLLEIQLK